MAPTTCNLRLKLGGIYGGYVTPANQIKLLGVSKSQSPPLAPGKKSQGLYSWCNLSDNGVQTRVSADVRAGNPDNEDKTTVPHYLLHEKVRQEDEKLFFFSRVIVDRQVLNNLDKLLVAVP